MRPIPLIVLINPFRFGRFPVRRLSTRGWVGEGYSIRLWHILLLRYARERLWFGGYGVVWRCFRGRAKCAFISGGHIPITTRGRLACLRSRCGSLESTVSSRSPFCQNFNLPGSIAPCVAISEKGPAARFVLDFRAHLGRLSFSVKRVPDSARNVPFAWVKNARFSLDKRAPDLAGRLFSLESPRYLRFLPG